MAQLVKNPPVMWGTWVQSLGWGDSLEKGKTTHSSIMTWRIPWTTVFFGRNDAKAETPVLWPPHAKSWLIGKDYDAGRDWGAGGKGDDRGWDGWMATPTRWMWVWVNSGRWWWTGRPGVLRFMGSQRVRHDWATELNWTVHGVTKSQTQTEELSYCCPLWNLLSHVQLFVTPWTIQSMEFSRPEHWSG